MLMIFNLYVDAKLDAFIILAVNRYNLLKISKNLAVVWYILVINNKPI